MAFIMPYWKRINRIGCFFLLLVISCILQAAITPSQQEAHVGKKGDVFISTEFRVNLPKQLQNLLHEGVPLSFALEYSLSHSVYEKYWNDIKRFFGWRAEIIYRLSYHPILNKYQLSMNGYQQNYASLEDALTYLGSLTQFNLSSALKMEPMKEGDIPFAQVRLYFLEKDMPSAFRFNPLLMKKWHLDSGRVEIHWIGSRE